MDRSLGMLAVLLLCRLLLPAPGAAGPARLPVEEENRQCLTCHDLAQIVVSFQNNETLAASVDGREFKASVHGRMACPVCHADFSGGNHPRRTFKSRDQYRIRSSRICRRCHTDEQIRRHDIHREMLNRERKGKAPVCTNCHGSHSVARVSGKRSVANEEQYCMKCHAAGTAMHFGNGEVRSAMVNASVLKSSVHGKLSCSDCHYGFSSDEHPCRDFKTARDFRLASSENCRRCHFDKYTKTLEGIHYVLLKRGRLNAPVCTDCHGSHDISRRSKDRSAIAKRCQRCHAAQYDIYARSVHGAALFNENNQDVPVCIDCHTAHTIQDPFSLDYREQIPEMCSNCHARKDIMGKYGLSTDVVTTYLSDFHGITLGLYKKQKGERAPAGRPIAVCTDCHGTHNITSTTRPDAAIVKKNLLKRCQKCHPAATERFPDAWLSHYEPSFTRTPLVYLAGCAFKVFIPLLIIGLVLQILLHIWRFAINR